MFKEFILPETSGRDEVEIAAGEYDLPLTFEPRTVLDIGAHVGMFTHWARTRWPDCTVSAFEPWAENAEMFRRNINGDARVQFTEAACFPAEHVHIAEGKNSFTNTIYPKELGWAKEDSKRMVRAVIPQGSYEFVKLDCEGAECDILPHLDLSATKAAVIEAHSETLARKVDSHMTGLGFNRLLKKYHGYRDVSLLKYARPEAANPLPQKVMVAMPLYGDLCGYTSQCLLKIIQHSPLPVMLNFCIGDSLVARARNTLTHQFLRSDATELLFIDSDLIFSGEQIARICAHSEPVVGGLYPKKQDKPEVEWVLNSHKDVPGPREDGLQKVAYIGTGFLRVKRHVFEQMIDRYGEEISYKDDCSSAVMHDLWPVGVYHYEDGTARYLSEDWFFCQRWNDLGGTVYADTKIVLKHVGQAIYPLKCQEDAILASSAPKEANA